MYWLNRAVVCSDCNRPTLDAIEGASFRVSALEHTELPKAPSFVRPAIVGFAISPAATGRSRHKTNPSTTPSD